jgi:uncharacterized protein (TIGR03435 family)
MSGRILRCVLGCALAVCAGRQAVAQQAKFEAVDVHASAKSTNPFPRTTVRGGRYELKTATMVDLIRTAYGFDSEKVVGGPNWLELDRFDVIGKLPEEATPEAQKQMLQAALEERFALKTHKDVKPLWAYVLTAGKKPNLREAEDTEAPGCKPVAPAGSGSEGAPTGMLMMSTNGGAPLQIRLGPGMTIQYACRNMTMEAFAAGLRGMIGTNLGSNDVKDETGLKGKWNFDLRFSMGLMGMVGGEPGERVSLMQAIEKLGLKLEERQVPTPVLVVDAVKRDPGKNPPEVAEVLPPLPVATEFEVASLKPAEASSGPMMFTLQMQPGGRLVARSIPLSFLLSRAFNTFNNDEIVGMPGFAQSDRYEIVAKVPAGTAAAMAGQMDYDLVAPLLLKLFEDRFNLKYHREDRPVTAYTLTAGKPKMKKADPESRTFCKNQSPPPGAPPGSRMLQCQNAPMALVAERLQRLTPELVWPVTDSTGLEGGWDFSLIFSMRPMMVGGPMMMRPPEGGGGGGGGNAMPEAAAPSGQQTIFEAIEKQLGLKLEKQKRPEKVIVIDHMEAKPTEN